MAAPNGDNTVHFEATSRRRSRRTSSMTVNLTPAIDITFLLLIFFVVSTRFAAVEGSLRSRLPAEQGLLEVTPLPVSPIRVRVMHGPQGYELAVDNRPQRPASFPDLTRMLEDLQARSGFDERTPVIILADDDVAWDHVTNCYNAIRRVGVGAGLEGVRPFADISFASGRRVAP